MSIQSQFWSRNPGPINVNSKSADWQLDPSLQEQKGKTVAALWQHCGSTNRGNNHQEFPYKRWGQALFIVTLNQIQIMF